MLLSLVYLGRSKDLSMNFPRRARRQRNKWLLQLSYKIIQAKHAVKEMNSNMHCEIATKKNSKID